MENVTDIDRKKLGCSGNYTKEGDQVKSMLEGFTKVSALELQNYT